MSTSSPFVNNVLVVPSSGRRQIEVNWGQIIPTLPRNQQSRLVQLINRCPKSLSDFKGRKLILIYVLLIGICETCFVGLSDEKVVIGNFVSNLIVSTFFKINVITHYLGQATTIL